MIFGIGIIRAFVMSNPLEYDPVVLFHWLVFVGVLIASGVLLCLTLVILMARTLLRPARMTDAKATWVLKRLSPGDLGLFFEEERFTVRDEQTGRALNLAGWWIPAGSSAKQPGGNRSSASADGTIVVIHGYADAKVGAIAWAPVLHSLGWNLLAIDLRAHGESQGTLSTAGYWERHDMMQVINELRARRAGETGRVVIFGVSLGAAVATATAALRDDIAAIILESPFADYRMAISAHGRMRGLPGGFLRDLAISLAEWMSGAKFRAVRPRDLIAHVACPVMLIHAGDDPFIPDEDAADFGAALKARNNPGDVLWRIPHAGHVLGLAAVGPAEYRDRIERFLNSTRAPVAHAAQAAGENAPCSAGGMSP
jgi:pimeloyl-ACP methyl ester carboxylesterase